MWLSKQMKLEVPTADADLGSVTIAGGSAGVVTRGEVRALPVYGPGGGAVYLRKDGTVELRGTVSIQGQLVVNGEPYKPCTCGTEAL